MHPKDPSSVLDIPWSNTVHSFEKKFEKVSISSFCFWITFSYLLVMSIPAFTSLINGKELYYDMKRVYQKVHKKPNCLQKGYRHFDGGKREA